MEICTGPRITVDGGGVEWSAFGPDHSIADICRWLMENRSEAEDAVHILVEMLNGTYGLKRQ